MGIGEWIALVGVLAVYSVPIGAFLIKLNATVAVLVSTMERLSKDVAKIVQHDTARPCQRHVDKLEEYERRLVSIETFVKG